MEILEASNLLPPFTWINLLGSRSNIPYSLICGLFSRNLKSYLYIFYRSYNCLNIVENIVYIDREPRRFIHVNGGKRIDASNMLIDYGGFRIAAGMQIGHQRHGGHFSMAVNDFIYVKNDKTEICRKLLHLFPTYFSFTASHINKVIYNHDKTISISLMPPHLLSGSNS